MVYLTEDPYEEAAQQALEQAPPTLEYVSDPMELVDHVLMYVPEPDYPEYLAPSNDDILVEDQPLPADASPVALSPSYIADSNPKEDEEDHEKDPADDDESSDDNDDNDNVEEDEEEEEHLAPTDSTAVASPAVDHVPSAEETEPFETDESAATPPQPPAYRTTPRMNVRTQTPISFPFEEEVDRLLALPTPPPSPLTLLSSPLTSPTYAQAPLAPSTYHSLLPAGTPLLLPIPLPAPSISRKDDLPEVDMLLQKRLLLTAPTPNIEAHNMHKSHKNRSSLGFHALGLVAPSTYEDDDVVVLENSETKEEDVKEDESDHNKERYTFEDDDDGEFDDLD
ncbi:hypothetical protein Tco_0804118 [Tanacetum coccineum]|uniref:Uncharacterized protein n=1 Tax=Tanacetum coccineum TaxID=301880 RepID=A0ABQ5A7N5_9ASTR